MAFFPPWVGVGLLGPLPGLVIALILVLAPWCPERIMKEERRGQGGAQAAGLLPVSWAVMGGEVGDVGLVSIKQLESQKEELQSQAQYLCALGA